MECDFSLPLQGGGDEGGEVPELLLVGENLPIPSWHTVGLPQLRCIHPIKQLILVCTDTVSVPGTGLGAEGRAVQEEGKLLSPRSLQSMGGDRQDTCLDV